MNVLIAAVFFCYFAMVTARPIGVRFNYCDTDLEVSNLNVFDHGTESATEYFPFMNIVSGKSRMKSNHPVRHLKRSNSDTSELNTLNPSNIPCPVDVVCGKNIEVENVFQINDGSDTLITSQGPLLEESSVGVTNATPEEGTPGGFEMTNSNSSNASAFGDVTTEEVASVDPLEVTNSPLGSVTYTSGPLSDSSINQSITTDHVEQPLSTNGNYSEAPSTIQELILSTSESFSVADKSSPVTKVSSATSSTGPALTDQPISLNVSHAVTQPSLAPYPFAVNITGLIKESNVQMNVYQDTPCNKSSFISFNFNK